MADIKTADIKYIGSFPSDENPPELKVTETYGCAWARGIWQSAQAGSHSFNFNNNYATMKRNRKFARGMHDVAEYKPRAIAGDGKEFISIDYSITTPLPKMMRILKENIYSHQYKAKVVPYRSHVKTKYDEMKDKMMGKMLIAAEVRKLVSEGILPPQMALKHPVQGAPQSMEELQEKLDTEFVVLESIALQELIKASFLSNNIGAVERLVIDDLVENNKIALRAYVDENYCFKVERIDIVNMVTSYCDHDDFSDMTHVGHVKWIPASEFINLAKDKGLTEEEIINVVKSNVGERSSNGSFFDFGNARYFSDFTGSQLKQFRSLSVKVFCFEVIQADTVAYKEKELSTGGFDIKKKNSRYSTPNDTNSKAKSIKGSVSKLYCGEWVVGTDIMLDWGIKKNVIRKIRDGKYVSKPCFSYIMRQPGMLDMQNQSLVEEAIPHVEQIIIAGIKMQHFLAISSPPGYDMDTSSVADALSGLGLDGLKPLDLASIKRQLGIGFYSSKGDDGITQNFNQQPIRPTPSTLDQGLEILIGIINHHMLQVRDILGLNDSVDATQPKERAAVKNMQMAYAAHKASLKPIQDIYLGVMAEVAERAAYSHQMAIQAGKETEEIKQLLTSDELGMLKKVEVGEFLFNLEIAMVADSYQKDMMKAKIDFAVQQGTLDIEDAMLLDRLIEENPENAEIVYRQKKAERERKLMEQEQQRSQMLIEQQQAQAEAVAQMEEMKKQADLEKETAKKDLDLRNMEVEYELKTKYLVVELDGKKEMIELQARLQDEQTKREAVTQGLRPATAEPSTDVSPRVSV